ncbi:MAG TPA: DUF4974 domain-containing protein [Planctomycetota bacterium]|nr:DUF4974 domain-containing protein [Planctomycetota bacterium]
MKIIGAWCLVASLAATAGAQSPFLAARLKPQEVAAYRALAAEAARLPGDVDFENVGLGDAIRTLARRFGRTFVIDDALKDRLDEPVGFVLRDVRMDVTLKTLARTRRVRFLYEGGFVRVTTPDDADRRRLETRIYDVSELLYAPPDFPGPQMDIRPGRPATPPEESVVEGRSTAEVVDLLRDLLGDAAWTLDGATIEISGKILIVRQTPERHAEIRRAIAVLSVL